MIPIRTVELFAGVGGFRLGLEKASNRYRVIYANQWEPKDSEQYAFKCYENHFGHSLEHICKDIAKIRDTIPDHDFLVGGFPCQDYSVANTYACGIEGKKGSLWWHIDYILKKCHPSFVLLENVDGLLTSPLKQIGRDFSIILRSFYQAGYAVEWRVINAAEYGQAQRRRRIFMLGYYRDQNMYKSLAEKFCKKGLSAFNYHIGSDGIFAKAFPVKSIAHSLDTCIDEMAYLTVNDLADNFNWKFLKSGVMINGFIYTADVVPIFEEPIPLKDILETDVSTEYDIREHDMPRWKYLKGAKRENRTDRNGNSYLFTEGTVAFPDALNKPARTIMTSETSVSRMSHVIQDPQTRRLRTLTPLECERLNGFPDNWTYGMPNRYRYFTMGNALVVPLIERIGKKLISQFS